MPSGGFHTKPSICFSHNCDCVTNAVASTYDLVLKFEEMLFLSFKGYDGFGKV